MKNSIVVFTKRFLDVLYIISVGGTLISPGLITWYSTYNPRVSNSLIPLIILFFIAGIFGALILRELKKMMNTVVLGDCFVRSNVTSLKRMGTFSFVISGVMFLRVFTEYFTPSIPILVFTFLVAGLFSKVLAIVFDQAVSYKLENDMTI